MTRASLLTQLGRALGGFERRPDPPRTYFRCEQAKLDAERDAAAPLIQDAIRKYQHRFSRAERARSRRAKAARSAF